MAWRVAAAAGRQRVQTEPENRLRAPVDQRIRSLTDAAAQYGLSGTDEAETAMTDQQRASIDVRESAKISQRNVERNKTLTHPPRSLALKGGR